MKKRLILFAKIAVSVSLLLYLLSIVDLGATVQRLRETKLAYCVAAFFISMLMIFLSSLKWKIILAADGVRSRYPMLLQSYYIGNFISLFLPSGIGGDVYRVYNLSSAGKQVGKVTSSVLFDRLSGLGALLSISLFGYLALAGTRYDAALFALYLAGIASFFAMTAQGVVRTLSGSRFVAARYLGALLASFRAYRSKPGAFLAIVAIAFTFQFLIVFNNFLYTRALSIDISMTQLIVIIPLIFLTEVLPVSINGAGVRDSAFVFFFVQIGHTKEEGLAMGLLVIAMRYLCGLVGGTVLLASAFRTRKREASPE
ncbi:MAG: flippase-like domain-containing protein [Proteobacteria bacterium]|nr:flippase-like domain-containing protein [Pseudomonadota bacterium]